MGRLFDWFMGKLRTDPKSGDPHVVGPSPAITMRRRSVFIFLYGLLIIQLSHERVILKSLHSSR